MAKQHQATVKLETGKQMTLRHCRDCLFIVQITRNTEGKKQTKAIYATHSVLNTIILMATKLKESRVKEIPIKKKGI
jgi:hypothetical protein